MVTNNIEIPAVYLGFLDENATSFINGLRDSNQKLEPTNFPNYGILIKRALLKELGHAIDLFNSTAFEIAACHIHFNYIVNFLNKYSDYFVQDSAWCTEMLSGIQSLVSNYTEHTVDKDYSSQIHLKLKSMQDTLSSVPASSNSPSHSTAGAPKSPLIMIKEVPPTPEPEPLSPRLQLSGMAVVIGLIAGTVIAAIVQLTTLNTLAAVAAGIATTIAVTTSLTVAKSCFFNQAPKKTEKESLDLTRTQSFNFD